METRKEEIIKTAAKLFKAKGYSAVTMRDIAKVMNIKAASLYNHITSKQDILKDIIIALAEEFTTGIATIKSAEVDNLEKLKRVVSLHVEIAGNNTEQMACLNNDWMHLEGQLDYYLQLRSDYEEDFRKIIKEGMVNGNIIDTDPEIILFSILSTLRSLYLWIPKKGGLETEELAERLSEVLINGINT
ncbi:TetR/AcrR family transcriptional regulator [Spongiimicrobium salis]|uniref:TetR/AcrR family transcriptional regulator n=1 Tax=Spongiimicrobium salis TaxID=1667022 RepID=UPI00374DA2A5